MPKQRSSKQERMEYRRRQADRRRPPGLRRLVITGIIVVIVVALGLVGWSVYNFQVKPYNQTVINFNGTTLNMRYFINMLKIYYNNAPPDTTIAGYADFVEQQIERGQTVIQGAAALGVSVDRSAVEDQLKAAGLPVDREHVDVALAQRIMDEQVPQSQPQYNVQALLVESREAADAAIARLQAGEAMASVTGDNIVQGEVGWVTPRQVELEFGETAFGSRIAATDNGTIGEPFYDDNVTKQYGFWIAEATDLTPATENTSARAHVLGLLLPSREEAQAAIDRINAGEDINDVARDVSLVPGAADNGADLGEVILAGSAGEFARLADLPLFTLVGPVGDDTVQTPGGYWVYRIADTDPDRALSGGQSQQLEQDWLDRCTAALKEDPDYKVENLLDQEMTDFALNEVVLAQGEGSVLIATDDLPDGEATVPYEFQIKTYGNDKGNTWSLQDGRLPTGLSLDTQTGILSGTPELAGGAGFKVRVDSGIHYNDKDLVIRIHIPANIQTTELPDGTVNATYQQAIDNIGDVDVNTWSIVAGSLPDGLQISESSGLIYGKPTAAGTFSFTVQVDDGNLTDTQDLTITIRPETP